jgi:hypothetical protein
VTEDPVESVGARTFAATLAAPALGDAGSA